MNHIWVCLLSAGVLFLDPHGDASLIQGGDDSLGFEFTGDGDFLVLGLCLGGRTGDGLDCSFDGLDASTAAIVTAH